jgi:U3 small nucleolar ribonucleoprotein protein IMP3
MAILTMVNRRQLAHLLSNLDPADPFRVQQEEIMLEKLWQLGILKQNRAQGAGLSSMEKDVTVSAIARRRLAILMVRISMVPDVKSSTRFIEQGHVRVGSEVVT